MTDFNQTRGFSLKEGRETSERASELYCCFCPRRGRARSQINYCWSSGFGEGIVCLVWDGGTDGDLDADKGSAEAGTCESSRPLLATERSIIPHLSPLSRMPLDQIRWPEGEGGRVQQSAAAHLLLQSACWGPVQVTQDTVGVKEQTVCEQTDEEGPLIPPGWLEGRNAEA